MVPSDLGRSLIDAFRLVDASLVQPTIRANMEKEVAQIAAGTREQSEVGVASLSRAHVVGSLSRANTPPPATHKARVHVSIRAFAGPCPL